MKYDEFGDRMKAHESVFTNQTVNADSVLCVRIDGKRFSKFTKGFAKPFDTSLTRAMIETTKQLVKDTGANIGYSQSDEITLIYTLGEKANEYIFGGKTSKINSVFASMATAHFNHFIQKYEPLKMAGKGYAYFDCRSWGVPTTLEASNVLLWRVQDARKNSVSSLFRWTAGAKKMIDKNQSQMKEYLLAEHHVDWNDLPNHLKYGSCVKPISYELSAENGPVVRSKVEEMGLGYYGDLSLEERINFIEK